ncbi:hypothetical protein BN1708_010095 [Verticillium longisporum]|uniref:Uncharacterized protein n=1 Tax=Verticillium longisporum TaxID=100787 RepID=A0A0G4KNH4_VERLO|nr:hypothetical protein BN1708_010095 [Verticillium longisporum]
MASSRALPASGISGFAGWSAASIAKRGAGKRNLVSNRTLHDVAKIVRWHLLRKIEADEIIPARRPIERADSGHWCRGVSPRDELSKTAANANSGGHVESVRERDQLPSPTPLLIQDQSVRLGAVSKEQAAYPSSPSTPSPSTPSPATPSPSAPSPPSRPLVTEPTWPTHRFAPSDDGDALHLRSTPYSLNMPTFCHGRIRIPKPGLVLYADVMPDKTLDWTAFQVAILGGAGDFFSDSLDPMHGSDDDELEDITTWFDDFGFKSEGRLVRARRSAPPGRLGTTHSRRRSDAASSNSAVTADSDTDFRGEAGIEDIIPMGYNIGHDLTDFLEWASGYA